MHRYEGTIVGLRGFVKSMEEGISFFSLAFTISEASPRSVRNKF